MSLLAGGKYLNAHVNVHELADRAATEKGFWLHITNLTSTHPIITWRTHALRDRTRSGRLFLRPKKRLFAPDLPSGYTFSGRYPSPDEAMALILKARSEGRVLAEEQFGRYPFSSNLNSQSMRANQIRPPANYAQDPEVSRKPSSYNK